MANEVDISGLPSIPKEEDISVLPSIPAEVAKEDYSTTQQAKDLARTVAQGAALGFSDEAIAMARSILEKRKYEDVVKEEREALERYSKEYPVVSTLAELGGGLLPTLATGGGSTAATAARAGVGTAAKIAAKEGAKFGAITALGKTEDLAEKPIEAAKEVAVGALTGGALSGALTGVTKGVGAAFPVIGEKFGEYFPRSKTAFEYGKKTGKDVGSIEPFVSQEANRSAANIAETLYDSQLAGSKRIGEHILNATKTGVKITEADLNKSKAISSLNDLAGNIDEVLPQIPTDKRNFLMGFYEDLKSASPGTEFSPEKIFEARKILSETYNGIVKENPNISFDTKNKMIKAEEALRLALEDKVKGYRELNSVQHELYNAFEHLIDNSVNTTTKYTRAAVGEQQQKALLTDTLEKTFKKSGLTTSIGDPYRTGLSEFSKKLKEVFRRDADLIESGVIKPEQSMFAVLDEQGAVIGRKDPEAILSNIKKATDLQTSRIGAIGSREVAGEKLEGITDVLGYVLSERGMIKVASKLGQNYSKVTPSSLSKTLEVARKIYDSSPKSIGQLSSMLLNDPATKHYGESLREAELENNQQKKNAALFAAMQNPKSRQMIMDASLERSLAGSEEADEDYIQKRNKFILEQESGPKMAEKKEFKAYEDSGGLVTIGHGYNLDAPGQYQKMKMLLKLSDEEAQSIYKGELPINKKQADILFNFSLRKAEKELNQKLADSNVKLNPNQRAALVSMIYNSPKLVGPKILEALESGDYEEVARLIRITSDSQAFKHPGLPIRRRKEAQLFSGEEEEKD